MIHRLFPILAPLLVGACAVGGDAAPPSFQSRPASRPLAVPDGVASPSETANPALVGLASWYGPRHQGRLTASGAPFDRWALTAAHPFLPMGTRLRVVHADTGRSVLVTVNDRGPHAAGRILDLSWRAARDLGLLRAGVALVRVEPLPGDAPAAPVRPASRGGPARFPVTGGLAVAERAGSGE